MMPLFSSSHSMAGVNVNGTSTHREVPVLLIIFNRPYFTRRLIEALSAARPELLLVAADGPRSRDESKLCEATRACLSDIDWPCGLHTDFSDTNLGCGIRVHTAISWALSSYDRVIVLEDDCVPHPSFFRYCRELLSHYADDKRIMHISGNNFRGPDRAEPYSYYFSKYTHAWGWATWRRAWRHFDWSLEAWPQARQSGILECWCDDPLERRYWHDIFDRMHAGARDVWDYQWNFACWLQNGLAILPKVNLVANIGAGADATHTTELGAFYDMATQDIGEISHPACVLRNWAADAETFDFNFGGAQMRNRELLRTRLYARALKYIPGLRRLDRIPRKSD
jgi:hypothetical protein